MGPGHSSSLCSSPSVIQILASFTWFSISPQGLGGDTDPSQRLSCAISCKLFRKPSLDQNQVCPLQVSPGGFIRVRCLSWGTWATMDSSCMALSNYHLSVPVTACLPTPCEILCRRLFALKPGAELGFKGEKMLIYLYMNMYMNMCSYDRWACTQMDGWMVEGREEYRKTERNRKVEFLPFFDKISCSQASNLPCSWGWSWAPDRPASAYQVLVLQIEAI